MRCSKCVLPESIPAISFNEKNVCIYCQNNFPYYQPRGDGSLIGLLEKGKRTDSTADCLVGLSGGKDSTYTLIMLKEHFKRRVEAFTYVHDGTVPFSLENAVKICKKLKVLHHIVSLPKSSHLKVFAGFFRAFLDAPSPSTAGMTCVACKHLHLLGSDIARSRKIPFIVWSESPLEYSPFLALKLKSSGEAQMQREGLLKGGLLLLKEFCRTPAFPMTFIKHFNICLKGCLAAFPTSSFLKSYYPSVTSILFYDYHPWNPKAIKAYIKDFYQWKTPAGLPDDWHSDCLFNVFKEYTFQYLYRASYTDSYLSNQIRHGLLKRDEAISMLRESKLYYSKQLYNVLDRLHLHYLKPRIDTACFNVDID